MPEVAAMKTYRTGHKTGRKKKKKAIKTPLAGAKNAKKGTSHY